MHVSNPIGRVLALALLIALIGFGIPASQAKAEQTQECRKSTCAVDSHALHEAAEAREKAAKRAQKEAEHAAHEAAEECERAQKAYAHAQHEADEAKEEAAEKHAEAARKQAIADGLAAQCAHCR
jgi:hypothetical protein